MLKLSRRLTGLLLLVSIILAPLSTTFAADFKREVIYQIITDRFFDGSNSNNNPSQSSGLYDSTKTNWRAYWGGDLAGIQQKMSYLSGMGGVDGFRIDAIKHLDWGWQYSLANSIYTFGDSFLFGEWFQGTTSDPLYHDSYKFANKSGISMLDFPLNTAIRNVFGPSNANFSEIDSVIAQEGSNFTWKEDLVTFIDNHDMARFLSINNNNNRLHEALAFTLTSRGIPCIYYGTEQYLHNDTSGGTDPYNRPMMVNFSTSTTAYQIIAKLSTLRRKKPRFRMGR
jgi:glycosidase